MKKHIVNLVIPALVLCSLFACSKWTEPESAFTQNKDLAPKSEEYYAQLRDWKYNNKHPRTFGWFGNWTGKGASGQNRLMGLPDSVDFVSMWGNWWGLSPEQMADKKMAKDIKGLRVKVCFIIANIGDQTTPKSVREEMIVDGKKYNSSEEAMGAFWGWYQQGKDHYGDSSPEGIEKAIRKYANSIIDTINKYDFDGFDYDLERDFGAPGNMASYTKRMTVFFEEMSKHFGPKSGTNRLLCCDGQPNILETKCAEYIDFFIMQAYYARNYQDLEGQGYTPRVIPVVEHYRDYFKNEMGFANPDKEILSRIILCEDFEQDGAKGGNGLGYSGKGGPGIFTARDGRKLPPIWGMADYHTVEGYQIGGAGIFHMEYDYTNTYNSIADIHKDNGMDFTPAKATGQICYGYLNGIISLLHNPVNPDKQSVE